MNLLHPYFNNYSFAGFVHRGGNEEKTENTLEAFQHASDLGFIFMETDVQATNDGEIVVFHDNTLNRLAGVDKKISDLSVTSYAHYFTNYSGESFNIDSVKQVSPTQIYVHTTLVLPEENDVSMDYLLKKKGKNWHIVNIITNGISDLALKRSEYVAVLKKSGLDALLAQLDVKIAKFSN